MKTQMIIEQIILRGEKKNLEKIEITTLFKKTPKQLLRKNDRSKYAHCTD